MQTSTQMNVHSINRRLAHIQTRVVWIQHILSARVIATFHSKLTGEKSGPRLWKRQQRNVQFPAPGDVPSHAVPRLPAPRESSLQCCCLACSSATACRPLLPMRRTDRGLAGRSSHVPTRTGCPRRTATRGLCRKRRVPVLY